MTDENAKLRGLVEELADDLNSRHWNEATGPVTCCNTCKLTARAREALAESRPLRHAWLNLGLTSALNPNYPVDVLRDSVKRGVNSRAPWVVAEERERRLVTRCARLAAALRYSTTLMHGLYAASPKEMETLENRAGLGRARECCVGNRAALDGVEDALSAGQRKDVNTIRQLLSIHPDDIVAVDTLLAIIDEHLPKPEDKP